MLKILLTNDDGADAPGLQAMWDSVQNALRGLSISAEILVVAPDRCRSECGHSIETSRPLTISEVKENWHALDGTPVDCVRVAVHAMQFKPNLVLSGINAGANLGVNLMVSGTFAAAREANVFGLPSMAISHYRHPDVPKNWAHTPEWLEKTLSEFIGVSQQPQTVNQAPLWNVNLPAVHPESGVIPERVICDIDRRPLERFGSINEKNEVHFELDFHNRPRESGRDVAHCFNGYITVSKLDSHQGE